MPGPSVVQSRGKLDPTDKPLWRLRRSERPGIVEPFVGHWVRLERWMGRVASHGDKTYHGEIVAVATSTIGSAADLVILKTVDGTVWAISVAQVAHLSLAERGKK